MKALLKKEARPGLWLAKVAGATPIRQGRLLSD